MANRKPISQYRRQALLVLGMQRSGTSEVSGLLALLGAEAPATLIPPTCDSSRTSFESAELRKVNERVLSSAGSRCDDWGQFNPEWFDSLAADQQRESLPGILEKEYGTAPLLLVTDPRISRFLPLWTRALRDAAIEPAIVIPVRHPLAVARSVEVRDRLGRNTSLLLWLRHMLDVEADSRQLPRTFVSYEGLLADWKSSARHIGRELGVVWPRRSDDTELEVDAFFGNEIQHHSEGQQPIAATSQIDTWVRQTYEVLKQACEGPLESSTLGDLDRIRSEFNHGAAIYSPVVREHEKRAAQTFANLKADLARSVETCQRQATMLSDRSAVREQFGGHQNMIDDQTVDRASASNQGMDLTTDGHAVIARLEASEAEGEKLRAEGARYETLAAAQSQQLAEKNEELGKLKARLSTMASESGIASAEHQSVVHTLQRQLQRSEEEVANLSGELLHLKSSIDAQAIELQRALTAAETTAKVRFRETAKLTEMLFQNQAATARQASRIAELVGDRRQITLLEYRNAVTQSTMSRRLGIWQHQASIYGQALNQVRSSRAWSVLSRLQNIRLPSVQEPDLDAGVDAQVEILCASGLFDARWYLERYPDAADSGMDPERHYLLIGATAGYNPGPEFDSVAYLMEYPDVREAAVNPLLHYVEYGQAESRTRTAPVEPGK